MIVVEEMSDYIAGLVMKSLRFEVDTSVRRFVSAV